jgi:hypothetical protein
LLSERGPSKYTSLFHRRAFNRALGSTDQQSLHELVPPVHWNIREMRNSPLIHEKVELSALDDRLIIDAVVPERNKIPELSIKRCRRAA